MWGWLQRRFSEQPQQPDLEARHRTNAVYAIPVLLISYFPLKNGAIDRAVTGDVSMPLAQMREHVARTTQTVIAALEKGSAYHGYKDPSAQPSLRYTVLDHIQVHEALPTYPKAGHRAPMTDYNAILNRFNIEDWVLNRGVKEVWIWGYHGNVVDLWESNMAGPWGDISNSDRDLHDLPVFDRTYTVYHYNYGRGPSEAVEDHMHQIEAVLRHADPELFWNKFVGRPGEGRCGWSHYPPNAVRDYDWANRDYILTDIEDWRPDGGGERQRMNCTRWHCDSLTWFIYWMQNVPGLDNDLTYRGRPLTNWWHFIGDYDTMRANRIGLIG